MSSKQSNRNKLTKKTKKGLNEERSIEFSFSDEDDQHLGENDFLDKMEKSKLLWSGIIAIPLMNYFKVTPQQIADDLKEVDQDIEESGYTLDDTWTLIFDPK